MRYRSIHHKLRKLLTPPTSVAVNTFGFMLEFLMELPFLIIFLCKTGMSKTGIKKGK